MGIATDIKRGLRALLVVALAAFAAGAFAQDKGGDDDALEHDRYERATLKGSTIEPAKANLAGWFEVRHFPFWHDRNGATPAWEEIGPSVLQHSWGDLNNAGRCCAVVVDPTDPRIVWVGAASGGIWRSTDEGKTWNPVGDQNASLSIGALALDPFDHNTIYAGTGEPHNSIDSFFGAGLLRSSDGGQTWTLLSSDVYLGTSFSRIVPHPSRPGFLYAATTRGVLRSLDGGGTWVQLLKGAATDLLIDPKSPDTLVASIGASGGSPINGLYKTTDAGQTWKHLTNDLPSNPWAMARIQMANCQAFPNVLYVSIYGTNGHPAGMYKSTDFGESWIRLPNAPDYAGGQSWYDNYVMVSPVNPNVVFVGGTSTYRTVDGGDTWIDDTRSYAGGPVHPDNHFLAFSPVDPSTLYLCTDGGVFRSRNLGESWESVSNGLGTVQFQSLDVHPWDPNVAYGGTQDNGTNKYTGSKAWTNVFLGDGGVTHVNWKNPNIVYTEYVDLTICKSTDAGHTWDWNDTNGIDPHEGKLFYAPYNLDPSDPDTLVAGAQKVYRSTDAAASWTAISPILGSRVSAVVVAPSARGVIYAGTTDGHAWVTPNTGKNWYDISKGLPRGAYVNDICVDPRDARTVYLAINGWAPDHIWKSTDAGGHWTNLMDNLPPMPVNAIALDPHRPNRVYLATQLGVFVSDHGDGQWRRFGSGLPNVPVFSIVANARTGYVTIGTHGRGGWRIPLPD